MGIVMTIAMLMGLFALLRKPYLPARPTRIIAFVLVASGVWNTFWYGAQNLSQFWGQAALVSGLVMLLTAMHLLHRKQQVAHEGLVTRALQISLMTCFLLYAVTLIQLNLGYQIIA